MSSNRKDDDLSDRECALVEMFVRELGSLDEESCGNVLAAVSATVRRKNSSLRTSWTGVDGLVRSRFRWHLRPVWCHGRRLLEDNVLGRPPSPTVG